MEAEQFNRAVAEMRQLLAHGLFHDAGNLAYNSGSEALVDYFRQRTAPGPIGLLRGKTLAKVVGCEVGSEDLTMETTDGWILRLWHAVDCCETVKLADVCGDPFDLIGAPLLLAEESSNQEEQPEGTQTWSFYRFATAKGSVVLRWLGESNGYYSEKVACALNDWPRPYYYRC